MPKYSKALNQGVISCDIFLFLDFFFVFLRKYKACVLSYTDFSSYFYFNIQTHQNCRASAFAADRLPGSGPAWAVRL